jgi:single-strand DNA-binding protein
MMKDTTDFIECVSWRQSAEYLSQYGHKGDIVAVSGSLQSREWTDKDGKKRKAWEVVTTSVELLSSKRNSEASTNTAQNQNGYPGGYGQPQQGYCQPPFNQQGFGNYAPIVGEDGQLPF